MPAAIPDKQLCPPHTITEEKQPLTAINLHIPLSVRAEYA